VSRKKDRERMLAISEKAETPTGRNQLRKKLLRSMRYTQTRLQTEHNMAQSFVNATDPETREGKQARRHLAIIEKLQTALAAEFYEYEREGRFEPEQED
jgi:hypothetical protein